MKTEMKRRVVVLALWMCALLVARPAAGQPEQGTLIVAEVQGVINPLSAQYLERTLRLAEQQGAQAVIVLLDTPGGLESAMRDMVQALLEAPLPVVVYVAPQGARATSAGLFITLAADVAAMAPATHLGAAHPVPLGADVDEVMDEKLVSDAAALVRSVAERRGRNAEWAERAVRENLSVTAQEALDLSVVDLLADDLEDLLRALDGHGVAGVTLQTAGAAVERYPMNLAERFLHLISDPNIAYLLLSLGVLFLLAELVEPGLSVAGVLGVVALIVAFMALGSLPLNWAGVALLALSVVLFVVGLLTDTEAIVTVAGLVPFVLGSLLLFTPFTPTSPAAPTLQVSPWLVGLMALVIMGFSFVVLRAVIAATRRPPQSGAQRLIGQRGVATTDLAPGGQVRVDLQEWSAVAVAGEVRAGDPVQVVGIAGVRLQVVPAARPPLPTVDERMENQGGL